MKDTLFRKILPIILIILCLSVVQIQLLRYALCVFLAYYLYRLFYYLLIKFKTRKRLQINKELKSEFYMEIFAFLLFGIPLFLIYKGFAFTIKYGYKSLYAIPLNPISHMWINKITSISVNGIAGYCILLCFCFGAFMVCCVQKHLLRYNKQELLNFENEIQYRVLSWVASTLGNK
jgi:hypothetical protein